MSASFEIWAGALCTLVIFSFVYKENPVYRFFEHIFVGLGIGYGLALTWTDVLKPNWWDQVAGTPGQAGNPWWLLCVIPGAMWYFQFSTKSVWISRLIIGFFMGFGATAIFDGYFGYYFGATGQVTRSLVPLWKLPSHLGGSVHLENVLCAWSGGALHVSAGSINNGIFLIVLFCCVTYFYFSFNPERRPWLRRSTVLGRYFFMVCFGAIFGNTIMGRLSLLLGRLEFLLRDWLHVI